MMPASASPLSAGDGAGVGVALMLTTTVHGHGAEIDHVLPLGRGERQALVLGQLDGGVAVCRDQADGGAGLQVADAAAGRGVAGRHRLRDDGDVEAAVMLACSLTSVVLAVALNRPELNA